MHHVNTNKTHIEKARRELRKNVVCCLEQVLEAASHKITAEQQPAYHLTNYSNKMKKTFGVPLLKQGLTHKG